MRRPTSIILIALFAACVCADELKTVGANGPRADFIQSRPTLVDRISVSLRRMVKPALVMNLLAHATPSPVVCVRPTHADAPFVAQVPSGPFQFRLPPPALA